MTNQKPTVVVVEPYSTASGLPAEFATHGWEAIAVVTEDTFERYGAKLRAEDFTEIMHHSGEISVLADKLRRHNVAHVISGTDMGVDIADELAAQLGLPGNNPRSSQARYDKGSVATALAAAGVDGPKTLSTASRAEAQGWAETQNSWPLVLKPSHSAGCDGLAFCDNIDELMAAWDAVAGKKNFSGLVNHYVVIQECLIGDQYMCNSVSLNGVHYIQSVWREQMFTPGSNSTKFDYIARTLAPDAPKVAEISAYVRDVLDALEVKHGPADFEIMWTERGPVLIEINPRLMGGRTSEVEVAALGESHLTVTVEAVTKPDDFLRRTTYPSHNELTWIGLAAPYDATIEPEALAALRALPTVHSVRLNTQPDGSVAHTTVFAQLSGDVFLIGGDPDAIARDYARVRELEANGLYVPM
ncbi:MAG: ATP-grasp domain-containing protein [Corynebacteriales bacterium]|nr:ATP-grasp domain-containing protein [Mycobacteriales bacterium]